MQRYLEKHNLVERSRLRGNYLAKQLDGLRALPCVGDVRGKGMLQTVEFVADKSTRKPFAKEFNFNFRVFESLQARGVLVYPMRGTVEGGAGDHVLIAPPFIMEESQIDFLAEQMAQAIDEVGCAALAAGG